MKSMKQWFHSERALMGASSNSKAGSNSQSNAIAAGIRYHRRIYKMLELQVALTPSLAGWKLFVEPWFHTAGKADLCSPDGLLLNREEGLGVVIEVKKNWKDGRDIKLLDLYLPVVASAFGVKTRPLMIVGNVRGLAHEPLTTMADVPSVPLAWLPGQPTPTLLRP